MKKLCKICFGFLLAFALFFAGGFLTVTGTDAHAEGIVTITVSAEGGTCSVTEITTNAEGKIEEFPTAERADYYFGGWYSDANKTIKVTTDTVFETNSIIYAKWETKAYGYVISNGDNGYDVIGKTTGDDVTYVLSEELASIADAFNAISQDLDSESRSVEINFDNVTTNGKISISFQNVVVSGKITTSTSDYAIELVPTTNSSSFTFDNFTLSGSCLSYIDFTQTEYTSSVIFSDCTFDATTENDYGFVLTNPEYSLTFKKYFSHTSTYLYSYIVRLKVYMPEALTDGSMIVETSVYTNYFTQIVANFHQSNLDNFSLVPLGNYYGFNLSQNGVVLESNAYFVVDFQTNGGEFADGYAVPEKILYRDSVQTDFPTAENIVFNHKTFLGWIGTFTLTDNEKSIYGSASNTYYFNKTTLASFIENGSNFHLLDTYLSTTIPETLDSEYFTYYNFSSTANDVNFECLNVFTKINKTPTFIADIKDTEYQITFVTYIENPTQPITAIFGENITKPTDPQREGYIFNGWYTDETFLSEYTFSTMPGENISLYANWTAIDYTLTFHHNDYENTISTLTFNFEEPLVLPNITYTGHNFIDWYEDEELENKLTLTTMPSHDIDIYAKWEVKQVKIFLNTMCAVIFDPIIATYGEPITIPQTPDNPGYTFFGWYTSTEYTTLFNFNVMPEYNTIAYARWIQNSYTISFNSNGGSIVASITRYYGETITAPAIPVKANHTFNGWFKDQELTQSYTFSTMPNENLALYAKWTAKQIIDVSDDPQTFSLDDTSRPFVANDNISGFIITYFVDGEWTRNTPSEVGKYNVRIYRAEDDTYAEVNVTIENGYILNNKTLDLLWLILLLYFLFIVEIVVVIFLRRLRQRKRSEFISLSIVLPFGIITTGQFVLILTGAVLFLFGFVLMIYELVKLHRTLPDEVGKPSDFDNNVNITRIVDKSEDSAIESRVDDLLKKEFIDYDNLKNNQTSSNVFDTDDKLENLSNDNTGSIDETDYETAESIKTDAFEDEDNKNY